MNPAAEEISARLRGERANANNPPANGNTLNINPLKYLEKAPIFDGKKEDLPVFIKYIEIIMPLVATYSEFEKQLMGNVIRSKLVGRARQVMNMHAHLESWTGVRDMLILNFSSFESIKQLFDKLKSLQYRGDVMEFYNNIQKAVGILNQKCIQENHAEQIVGNTETAKWVFMNGLDDLMQTILAARNPNTLEEALHILGAHGRIKTKQNNDYENKNVQKYQQNSHNMNKNNNQNNTNKNPSYKGKNYNSNHNNGSNNKHFIPKFHSGNNFNNKNHNQWNRNVQNHQNSPQQQNDLTLNSDVEMKSAQTRGNYNLNNDDAIQSESNIVQTIQNFPLLASDENYHI